MKITPIVEALVEAGASPELILAAVRAAEQADLNALERRRAADRERQAKHRRTSRESRDVTVTDNALPSSGSSSPEPLSTPNQPTSPPIVPPSQDRRATPEIVLQSVLDPMSAKRWSGHCGRRYSEETAQAHANVLRDIRGRGGSASDAIDLAIRRGWKTIEIEWLVNAGLKLTSPPPQSAEVDWPSRLEVFRSSATWAHAWGPKPGEPGCKVPPELLQERAA